MKEKETKQTNYEAENSEEDSGWVNDETKKLVRRCRRMGRVVPPAFARVHLQLAFSAPSQSPSK